MDIYFTFDQESLQSLGVGGSYGGIFGKLIYRMYLLGVTVLFIFILPVVFSLATRLAGAFIDNFVLF